MLLTWMIPAVITLFAFLLARTVLGPPFEIKSSSERGQSYGYFFESLVRIAVYSIALSAFAWLAWDVFLR